MTTHPYFLTLLGVGRRENPFAKGFYPAVVEKALRMLVSCLTVKYDKAIDEGFLNEMLGGVHF